MGVGEGSVVGDEVGVGDCIGARVVAIVATKWISVICGATVAVETTKRVTVGGIGVVNAATARAVRVPRLAKAAARHSRTAQKATKSKIARLTWLPGTRFRSNCMGIRVYHRDILEAVQSKGCDARPVPWCNSWLRHASATRPALEHDWN
jgi:hypothetical protein